MKTPKYLVLVAALACLHNPALATKRVALSSGILLEDNEEIFAFPHVSLKYGNLYAATSSDAQTNALLRLQPGAGAGFDILLTSDTLVLGITSYDAVLSLSHDALEFNPLQTEGALSVLFNGFSEQAHVRFATDAQGNLTEATEITRGGAVLPDGSIMGLVEPGRQAGGAFHFPNTTNAFSWAAGVTTGYFPIGYLFVVSGLPLFDVTGPAPSSGGSFIMGRDSGGLVGLFARGYSFRGNAPQFLLDVSSDIFETPAVAEVGGTPTAMWRGFGAQFNTVVRRLPLGAQSPEIMVGADEPVVGGDAIHAPGAPLLGTAIGDQICVVYPANLVSDPFGPQHLARTCVAPDASRSTEILLSPGEVIDGETITGFELDAGSVDGADVALRAFTQSGTNVVLWITPDAADSDADGIPDDQDNCIDVSNAPQRDTDADGIGNFCDADIRVPNDCIVNALDLGALRDAFFSSNGAANWNPDADFNGDGAVNAIDLGIAKNGFFQPPGPSGVVNDCGS